MADAKSAPEAAAATTTEAAPGLLDQIITNTKQTEPDRAQDLVKTLVEQALAGTVTFDRNLTRTFDKAVTAIDAKMSQQLNAIMHDPKFLKLEGSWRGLHYLVQNSETGTSLKIRVLNITKRELGNDLSRAIEFDQSQLFKKIYENEFGTPGGEPYGALIGDYEWTNHPDDIELLRLMSNIAAGAFAPFISAAGAGMFGFERVDRTVQAARPRQDLRHGRVREVASVPRQRGFAFRQPRHAARDRPPALRQGHQADRRVRLRGSAGGRPRQGAGDGSRSLLLVERRLRHGRAPDRRLRQDRLLHGDPRRRGRRQGGEPADPRLHVSDDGDLDAKCPTEIGITDRREVELSNLGFLPLCHYKNTDYAVFFGGQTDAEAEEVRPPRGDRQRGHLGPASLHHGDQPVRPLPEGHGPRQDRQLHGGRATCETWLNRWIQNYVNPNVDAGQDMKARFPLREARGRGEGDPGQAGLLQRRSPICGPGCRWRS